MALIGSFEQLKEEEDINSFDEAPALSFEETPPPPPINTDVKADQKYSDVEIFGNEVLSKIIADGVPVLPSSYDIYFRRLLEEKPLEFRENILKLIDIEDPTNEEKIVNLEKNVKKNLSYLNRMIKSLNYVYKNSTALKGVVQTSVKELENSDIINAKSSINMLKKSIEKSHNDSNKYLHDIKELYKKSYAIVQEVNEDATYDSEYGLYSKGYFLKALKQNYAISRQSKVTNSVLMIKLHSTITKKILSEKIRKHMSRMVAKLLHKNSKRSDIVAHYGNDIFLVILNKTDLFGAGMTAKRVKTQIADNSVFVGEHEYPLSLAIGVAQIDISKELKDNMSCLVSSLKKADKDINLNYVSCED